MTKHLEDLLEAAKKVVPTPEEKEQQRRSFAYGNTKIESSRITREMVDRAGGWPGFRCMYRSFSLRFFALHTLKS